MKPKKVNNLNITIGFIRVDCTPANNDSVQKLLIRLKGDLDVKSCSQVTAFCVRQSDGFNVEK